MARASITSAAEGGLRVGADACASRRDRGPARRGHLRAGLQPVEEQGMRVPQLQPQHRRLPLRPPPGEVPGHGPQQQPHRQPEVSVSPPKSRAGGSSGPPSVMGKPRHKGGLRLWGCVSSREGCGGFGHIHLSTGEPGVESGHLGSPPSLLFTVGVGILAPQPWRPTSSSSCFNLLLPSFLEKPRILASLFPTSLSGCWGPLSWIWGWDCLGCAWQCWWGAEWILGCREGCGMDPGVPGRMWGGSWLWVPDLPPPPRTGSQAATT